jgi:hypothetical protein
MQQRESVVDIQLKLKSACFVSSGQLKATVAWLHVHTLRVCWSACCCCRRHVRMLRGTAQRLIQCIAGKARIKLAAACMWCED